MSESFNNKEETVRCIIDFFHRIIMHHAFWFAEAQHQYGREVAFKLMEAAMKKSYDIQFKRLSGMLGFEMENGLPSSLMEMSSEKLTALKEGVAVNWLANDGVWFQTIEQEYGMSDAKRINDSSWAQFSPFEAWSVKKIINLPENSGLEGLKKALKQRLYASINVQEITEETENSFVFKMVDCRVQSARKRKGLEDYPCKSGGIIEYRSFAEAIDSRIKTECLACPPDPHPESWYCAWKFSM